MVFPYFLKEKPLNLRGKLGRPPQPLEPMAVLGSRMMSQCNTWRVSFNMLHCDIWVLTSGETPKPMGFSWVYQLIFGFSQLIVGFPNVEKTSIPHFQTPILLYNELMAAAFSWNLTSSTLVVCNLEPFPKMGYSKNETHMNTTNPSVIVRNLNHTHSGTWFTSRESVKQVVLAS